MPPDPRPWTLPAALIVLILAALTAWFGPSPSGPPQPPTAYLGSPLGAPTAPGSVYGALIWDDPGSLLARLDGADGSRWARIDLASGAVAPAKPPDLPPAEPAETLAPDLAQVLAPTRSPDGASVAFLGADAPPNPDGLNGRLMTLYRVETATGERQTLLAGWLGVEMLAWSPDGKWLLVAAEGYAPGGDPDRLDFTPALWRVDVGARAAQPVIRLDGGGAWRSQVDFRSPVWSPDGTRIAYVLVTYPDLREPSRRTAQIYLLTLDS